MSRYLPFEIDTQGVQIICGDARQVLRGLPARSVHCVVTSFPYLWARDYEIEPTVWGGKADCVHAWQACGFHHKGVSQGKRDYREGRDVEAQAQRVWTGEICSGCSAWRGSFGLEPTPAMYVNHAVEVCREIHRVLQNDGTFWLNLGSSYASGGRGGSSKNRYQTNLRGWHSPPPGYRHKSLIPIPWLVGIALQSDGWILRSDIIWSKGNPTPSPLKDRPTTSHEYVLQFTKKPKYYYDWFGVREPASGTAHSRGTGRPNPKTTSHAAAVGPRVKNNDSFNRAMAGVTTRRNLRTVWAINTYALKQKHYASFPPALVERCIKASTSEAGVCPHCGAPWKRILRRVSPPEGARVPVTWDTGAGNHKGLTGNYSKHRIGALAPRHGREQAAGKRINENVTKARAAGGNHDNSWPEYEFLGWEMGCGCLYSRPVPAVVLDPFGGSGTVAMQAVKMGRHSIHIDLNAEYNEMAAERVTLGR